MNRKLNLVKWLSFGGAILFFTFLFMMSPFAAMAGPVGVVEVMFGLMLCLLIATPGIFIHLAQRLRKN